MLVLGFKWWNLLFIFHKLGGTADYLLRPMFIGRSFFINSRRWLIWYEQWLNQILLLKFMIIIGTLISGTTFLLSAQYIVGLPAEFSILFVTIVIPALLINTIGGFILYQAINISLKRVIRAWKLKTPNTNNIINICCWYLYFILLNYK